MRSSVNAHLQAEVARLNAVVGDLRGRLDRLEGDPGGDGQQPPRSRRDLLKLAGVAALGAAGGVVLRAAPAAAATAGNMVLGQANDANATTSLTPTGGVSTSTTPTPMLSVTGPKSVAAPVPKPSTKTTGFLFFAPIQGYGGQVVQLDADNTSSTFAEGVDGYAGTNLGTGVAGGSDAGIGVGGASITGIDIFAYGNGSFAQVPVADGNGPSPGYQVGTNDLELVREADGSVWASRAMFVLNQGAVPVGTGPDSWKRMNTVRVDSETGDGTAFAPVRIVDTRDPAKNGGHPGPLAPFASYDFGPFPGVVGNGIPQDAVGIVGNLTAIAAAGAPVGGLPTFGAQGYLTIYPKGIARPGVSNVNFGGNTYAWPNAITVGFGTGTNAGSFTIYVFGIKVHVLVDVFGYIQ